MKKKSLFLSLIPNLSNNDALGWWLTLCNPRASLFDMLRMTLKKKQLFLQIAPLSPVSGIQRKHSNVSHITPDAVLRYKAQLNKYIIHSEFI